MNLNRFDSSVFRMINNDIHQRSSEDHCSRRFPVSGYWCVVYSENWYTLFAVLLLRVSMLHLSKSLIVFSAI